MKCARISEFKLGLWIFFKQSISITAKPNPNVNLVWNLADESKIHWFKIRTSAFMFCSHAKMNKSYPSDFSFFIGKNTPAQNRVEDKTRSHFRALLRLENIFVGRVSPLWYTLRKYSIRLRAIFTPSQRWAKHTWKISLFDWQEYSNSTSSREWDLLVYQSPDQGGKFFWWGE